MNESGPRLGGDNDNVNNLLDDDMGDDIDGEDVDGERRSTFAKQDNYRRMNSPSDDEAETDWRTMKRNSTEKQKGKGGGK